MVPLHILIVPSRFQHYLSIFIQTLTNDAQELTLDKFEFKLDSDKSKQNRLFMMMFELKCIGQMTDT
jgi:hypothetical protein